METIDIRAYQEWRDNIKREFEKKYSAWQQEYEEADQYIRAHMMRTGAPRADWSLQAYVDEMLEEMPKGMH